MRRLFAPLEQRFAGYLAILPTVHRLRRLQRWAGPKQIHECRFNSHEGGAVADHLDRTY